MSKTITIPTNCNPYIVVINNHVYTYKAGDTVEVPDEVAEAIEDALELEPKPKTIVGKVASLADRSITELTEDDFSGITKIGLYAFAYCRSLKCVSLASGITSINDAAFSYCDSLTSFVIHEKIASIGAYTFAGCSGLKRVILKPKTPPTIKAETFLNLPTTCVFEVPSEAVEAYKSAEYWSAFANQIKAVEE